MDNEELLGLVNQFIAKWQPRLHLAGWQITSSVTDTAGNMADANVVFTERLAHIRVNERIEKVATESAAKPLLVFGLEGYVETIVIHELLHLTEYPCFTDLKNEIEWVYGTDGAIGLSARNGLRGYSEHWIDQLARVLYEADRGAWI